MWNHSFSEIVGLVKSRVRWIEKQICYQNFVEIIVRSIKNGRFFMNDTIVYDKFRFFSKFFFRSQKRCHSLQLKSWLEPSILGSNILKWNPRILKISSRGWLNKFRIFPALSEGEFFVFKLLFLARIWNSGIFFGGGAIQTL